MHPIPSYSEAACRAGQIAGMHCRIELAFTQAASALEEANQISEPGLRATMRQRLTYILADLRSAINQSGLSDQGGAK